MALSAKHQRFVEEYLIDMNATEAYKRAGYKARGHAAEMAASRLMRNDEVKAAIEAGRTVQATEAGVQAADVIREMARIAFFDPRRLFNPDGSMKKIPTLDDSTAACLASLEVFEEQKGRGSRRKVTGHTRKVKLWDKNSALDKLAKHLNLYPPARHEHTGADGGPIEYVPLSDSQRLAALARIAARVGSAGDGPDFEAEGATPGSVLGGAGGTDEGGGSAP